MHVLIFTLFVQSLHSEHFQFSTHSTGAAPPAPPAPAAAAPVTSAVNGSQPTTRPDSQLVTADDLLAQLRQSQLSGSVKPTAGEMSVAGGGTITARELLAQLQRTAAAEAEEE